MSTLADLIRMVRQRTDTVASGFVSDDELLDYANASLAELDDVLVTTFEDYKITSVAAAVASASAPYFDLPADFLKGRGVDRNYGGSWVTLRPFSLQERNAYALQSALVSTGYVDARYRFEGTRCYIMPEQAAPASYRLWYVPRFAALTSTSSVIPDHMATQAWTEYAVADVCAKVLQKQDLDPSIFLAQKAALQLRVVNAAKTRDAGAPKKIVATRGRGPRFGGGWGR